MKLNINQLIKGLIGKKLKSPLVAYKRKKVWQTNYYDAHISMAGESIVHAELTEQGTRLYFLLFSYLYYIDFDMDDEIEVED